MQKTVSISALPTPMSKRFVVSQLARHWEAAGIKAVVGGTFDERADICILHHDRTRIEQPGIPEIPAGMRVLNGEALDISKRLYSALSLAEDGDWDGPVIVKTNLNSHGIPEHRQSRRTVFGSVQRTLSRYSWRMAQRLPPRQYPVLKSIRDVPGWIWTDTRYLVEKFVPERHEGLFSVRGWLFFGSRGYGYQLFATDPLVKTGSMVRHEFYTDIPDELHNLRRHLKLDFGKLDYVIHDGKAVVFDANKTPTLATDGNSPRTKMLAEGIQEFL